MPMAVCVGVFLLAMIGGGHETPESVRFLFDSINFDDVVAQCDANGGEIVIAVDMKMQGLICGLQNQSSLNPMPYDLWSQRECHSEEEVRFSRLVNGQLYPFNLVISAPYMKLGRSCREGPTVVTDSGQGTLISVVLLCFCLVCSRHEKMSLSKASME